MMVTRNEELWLTLGQAFLAPRQAPVADAFREELPDDLLEVADALGPRAHELAASFRRSLLGFPDSAALLRHYSALFLVPPVRAHLNLSYYLDGTLNGRSQDALDATYAHFGIARRDDFNDLPDHLAMMLEFLALLSAREPDPAHAAAFARRFLMPALPLLREAITSASEVGDSPYLHLLELLELSLKPLANESEGARRRRGRKPIDPDRGEVQRCRECGTAFATAKEIKLLRRALAEHGLPSGYLDICPDCRNPGSSLRESARD